MEAMNIKTSYVMTEEVHDMLHEAVNKTGKEIMDLIFQAMLMLVNDHRELRNNLGPVEYQKRFNEETGEPIIKHRVKVKMDRKENVLFQNMRGFYFMSISLLIALAVRKYLPEIIAYYCTKYYEDKRDSYPSGNYIYKEKCSGEATQVTVWWGVPPNFIKEFFS